MIFTGVYLLATTVVVFILLLKLFSPNVFPAKWRYAIGKMAAGFFLLPIALVMQWLWPLFIPKPTTTVPISRLPGTVLQTQSDLPIVGITKFSLPELNLSADAALLSLGIWGAGALAFAIWQIYCYRTFINKLQQTCSPGARIFIHGASSLAMKKSSRKCPIPSENNTVKRS